MTLNDLNGTNGECQSVYNVAVVGVGEVAMSVHLPTLLLCSDMFRTVALVDISKQALDHCSRKFHVPYTYTDLDEMLENRPEVDLVMIMNANEYHVIHTVKCLRAGKNVFVEKPMAITPQGAEEIERAQQETGKMVFVGYMRRYASAFLHVKAKVHQLAPGSISYVRVRDIIGMNKTFVDQSGTFTRYFTDFPPECAQDRKEIGDKLYESVLGSKSTDQSERLTWNLLNGLATHDLSAMRELFGMPQKVLHATRSNGGRFMTVLFQYDGFVAFYEMGIDKVPIFDAHIEIYAGDHHYKINYDTPYIKGLPITATIRSGDAAGEFVESNIRPTYEDAYTLEYKALYSNLRGLTKVKTTASDAKLDTQVLTMILEAL